ncbi:hypothetical protein R1sor_013831 [Riccia sorocarpa]|uniref:Uncharacterized protein n=1 Tax=Riccia sorocarpa TaxID=122646 RepID=A0ABD3HAQ6_9MARC
MLRKPPATSARITEIAAGTVNVRSSLDACSLRNRISSSVKLTEGAVVSRFSELVSFRGLSGGLSRSVDGHPFGDLRRPITVDFKVRFGVPQGMASALGNKGLSGKKRSTPKDLLEHATHMELENRFLEVRVKTLEEDGRKNRLKINDLRMELRECKEALEKERISVANYQKYNKELIASHAEMMLKWRKAIDEKRALRASLQNNQ